ncbi:hypothetical protein CONPUDRAFT_113027 [Coniophora puteana RWD-64-598 SS2]|uniref:GST N-terminal domain-containing protein n=1 Tax=Coniophora puteana (strain RWD-64-598) TaxID=741705 RepID=R7SFL7_CONPW|nr:uncharacterized protein CONPUDRAFT_113027 [Coniophora puteana RWD-64-598 SS2]EIW74532.1 hypothetical protein CONPUDRAFT_113027 [Coniophora puteana RWD-64-598 SS2]
MKPIILYDVPSRLPHKYWSQNTAKTRYSLSFKGLPYEMVWVEFPDIESTLSALGAPKSTRSDGSSAHTVPVIHDPNTGAIVADSFDIAAYLESTYPYPANRSLFPNGSRALVYAFGITLAKATEGAARWAAFRVEEVLNEGSREYFVRTREKRFGVRWAEVSPEGSEARAAQKKALKKGLDVLDACYQRSEGPWIQGMSFSYADVLVGAQMMWYRGVLRRDEWEEVSGWNGGRWGRVLEDVERECHFL